jgi:hypothetical protein
MKYLCLIYSDESIWPKLSRADAESVMAEYLAFSGSIRASGNYLGGHRLQPTRTGRTVRVRSGKVSKTDGPYAETKEQLGGYYLIDAPDLESAVDIASRIPGARFGGIEVRPITETEA